MRFASSPSKTTTGSNPVDAQILQAKQHVKEVQARKHSASPVHRVSPSGTSPLLGRHSPLHAARNVAASPVRKEVLSIQKLDARTMTAPVGGSSSSSRQFRRTSTGKPAVSPLPGGSSGGKGTTTKACQRLLGEEGAVRESQADKRRVLVEEEALQRSEMVAKHAAEAMRRFQTDSAHRSLEKMSASHHAQREALVKDLEEAKSRSAQPQAQTSKTSQCVSNRNTESGWRYYSLRHPRELPSAQTSSAG